MFTHLSIWKALAVGAILVVGVRPSAAFQDTRRCFYRSLSVACDSSQYCSSQGGTCDFCFEGGIPTGEVGICYSWPTGYCTQTGGGSNHECGIKYVGVCIMNECHAGSTGNSCIEVPLTECRDD